MIKPIGFTGLHINYQKNKPVLDKIVRSDAAIMSAGKNFSKISELSGAHDVYLKTSFYDPREEEAKGTSSAYDNKDKFVKLQITDKDGNVLSEVKTCTDSPKGSHEYCIANKLEMLAMKFAVASKNAF